MVVSARRIGTVTQGSPFRPRSTSHQMYRVRSAALEMPLYSGGSALLSLSAARQGESRQSAHGTPFGLPKISRICLACGELRGKLTYGAERRSALCLAAFLHCRPANPRPQRQIASSPWLRPKRTRRRSCGPFLPSGATDRLETLFPALTRSPVINAALSPGTPV